LSNGLSPLHLAAFQGFLNPIRCLVELHASVGMKDRVARTPLHLAAFSLNPLR
jgi:ankyrin repeat protein